jgi:hypothetical protein
VHNSSSEVRAPQFKVGGINVIFSAQTLHCRVSTHPSFLRSTVLDVWFVESASRVSVVYARIETAGRVGGG